MAHLFDQIPEEFFRVLASPNSKTYIDCIFIIYHAGDSAEDAFQGEREFIVSKLIDYFDDQKDLEIIDDIEDVRTSRQKAVHVINVLKNNGWIGEEELGNYKTSLNLFDYSIHIIDVLLKIKNNEQTEYTGEIFAVYSLLASFNKEEGIGAIEQAYQKTGDILRKLKALKANIYRYYYDITRKRADESLEIFLNKLLVEYKQNFFDSAYYNLKTTDSISRYKRQIIGFTQNILNNDDVMEYLTVNLMNTKKIDDYNESYYLVESKLQYINESFSVLEHLIGAIDRKNEQYVSAAAAKILYFTNRSDDIEGIFNRLFNFLLKQKDFEYNTLFNLAQLRNLDDKSLYSPRRRRIETIPEEILFDPDLITEEYRQEKIHMVFKNNIYGKKEIDSYVENYLGNKTLIHASDLPLETREDFIKLIMIFLYSKSVGMKYTVEQISKMHEEGTITFQNFVIRSRT